MIQRYGTEDVLLGLQIEARRYCFELQEAGETLKTGFHYVVLTRKELDEFVAWTLRHRAEMKSFATYQDLTPPFRRFLRDEKKSCWDDIVYESKGWVRLSVRDTSFFSAWRDDLEATLNLQFDNMD